MRSRLPFSSLAILYGLAHRGGLATAPAEIASDAGVIPTSDLIVEARSLIRRAVNEDRRGAQRTCANTVTDAKRMIVAFP
jgi:hypothetical protein